MEQYEEERLPSQVIVEVAKNLTQEQLQDIADLYRQLSPKGNTTTIEKVQQSFDWVANKFVLAIIDGHVIGIVIVQIKKDLSATAAEFDDVVVNTQFRERGYGEQLLRQAIEVARMEGAEKIYLTKNNIPERDNAKNLYEKLGFEKRDTTPYKLKL